MKTYRGSRGVAPLTLKLSKQNQHLNDNHAFNKNPIFDTVLNVAKSKTKNLTQVIAEQSTLHSNSQHYTVTDTTSPPVTMQVQNTKAEPHYVVE